jgi:hypothetical protein
VHESLVNIGVWQFYSLGAHTPSNFTDWGVTKENLLHFYCVKCLNGDNFIAFRLCRLSRECDLIHWYTERNFRHLSLGLSLLFGMVNCFLLDGNESLSKYPLSFSLISQSRGNEWAGGGLSIKFVFSEGEIYLFFRSPLKIYNPGEVNRNLDFRVLMRSQTITQTPNDRCCECANECTVVVP